MTSMFVFLFTRRHDSLTHTQKRLLVSATQIKPSHRQLSNALQSRNLSGFDGIIFNDFKQDEITIKRQMSCNLVT